MQQTFLGRTKSAVGAAFVGLGILILCGNLEQIASHLHDLLGCIPWKLLGPLPSVIVSGWRVWQTYGANQQRLLHSVLQHVLVSSWPLLLVIVGVVLLPDTFTDDVNAPPKKHCGFVDLTGGGSTVK